MGAGESKNEEKEATASEEASTAHAVSAYVALAAGAIYSLLASGSSNSVSNGILMKAPGQKGVTIPRDGFQDNPKDYFRRLWENAEKGASVGLAAGAIYSLLTSDSSNSVSNGKVMKARGQKGVTIPRDGFQDNSKDSFRRLSKNAEKGASVGLAAGAIYSLLASGSSNSVSNGKLMKAPGRKGITIRRNDFEENPKAYFSDLHKGKCNENENKKMMKARGQNVVTIRRTDFEDDPKGYYFSDLRKENEVNRTVLRVRMDGTMGVVDGCEGGHS